MTTEPELLSCPFCGGANVKASGSMSWTYVWCADCKAQGPTVWHGGPTADKDTLNRCQAEAIAAWNRREAATALSEAKAENERLREALKPFARCSEVYPDADPSYEAGFGAAYDPRCPLTLGDFHRARAALNPKGGDNGEG